MNQQELAILLSSDVRAWILSHQQDDPQKLAFMKYPLGFPAALAIGQVSMLQKAASKLPLWAKLGCILPPRAYEQATSEVLALAKPWDEGSLALDLTSGLGVDSHAIAQHYTRVISLEPDPVLAEVVRFNGNLFGIKGLEVREMRAEDFLTQYNGPSFDLIYIDPDRRDVAGNRKFGLKDCQPDVLALLPRLKEIGKRILIKASPMLDLTALQKEIGGSPKMWVLSEGNECKEILIDIGKEAQQTARGVIFVRKGETHAFSGRPNLHFSVWPEAQQPAYIFEPDVALYKSGLAAAWFSDPANQMTGGMTSNEGYFFSDEDHPDFHGHRFKVQAQMPFKPVEIKKYCKGQGISKIQYTRRDFDLPLEQVRKQVGIPDGGTLFLLLTRVGKERIAFVAERVA